MAAKPVTAERINARAARDKAFLKRALANPGLRSKLDPKYLSGAQKSQRTLNVRLNAPITPGSSMTERDLAHAAQAATTVRYGPQESELGRQLGVSQQTERDTGSFYDQYLQALQQHSQNIQAYQAGAQAGLAATAQGITGLGAQGAQQMQQQANQGAAQQGVAQAGQVGDLANQALASRQALIGSFQAQQASQGAAANTYGDTLANVVGPGQKLSALAQARGKTADVRKKQLDLKTLEGAFNQEFRDTRRQDEAKQVLATQIGLGNQAIAAGKAKADAAANTPGAAAAKAGATTTATEEAKNAAKLGLSVHQYRLLGPKVRKQRLDALNATKKGSAQDTVYTSGPFAGMTKSAVLAMSDSARQKQVDDYNAGKGKGKDTTSKEQFRQKYGVDLQPTSAHNSARDATQNAQTAFGQVGKVVKQADGRPHRVTTQDVISHLRDTGVSNLWIRVGLELARGGITPGTANRIHKAGYSVTQLGLKMRSTKTGSRGDSSAP